jgi:hypothetical protein
MFGEIDCLPERNGWLRREMSGYFERDGFLIERDRWVMRGREAKGRDWMSK